MGRPAGEEGEHRTRTEGPPSGREAGGEAEGRRGQAEGRHAEDRADARSLSPRQKPEKPKAAAKTTKPKSRGRGEDRRRAAKPEGCDREAEGRPRSQTTAAKTKAKKTDDTETEEYPTVAATAAKLITGRRKEAVARVRLVPGTASSP